MDVFLEDLSKGLPLKRTENDFQIELNEDLKPIKNGLHRKSHTQNWLKSRNRSNT